MGGYHVKTEAKWPPRSHLFAHISVICWQKIKTNKITNATNQELSKTVVRIVGWEPEHPVTLKRDFQVFGKQDTKQEVKKKMAAVGGRRWAF